MVAIHVAAVLSIHDLRADLTDDRLYAPDDLGEVGGVETLVGEAEQAHVLHPETVRGGLDVRSLAHPVGAVAEGFALAHDDRRHRVTCLDVPGDGSAASEQLVVGMSRDDEHALGLMRHGATSGPASAGH